MDLILKIKRDKIVGTISPPPGVIPDFEHPESRRHQVIVANAVLFPLATLVVILRIYTRAMIVRNVGSDDYAIILAWFFLVGHVITSIIHTNFGMGIHLWNVPLTTFSPHFLKMAIFENFVYGLSFLCVKVSILLLYLRLSPYLQFRAAVWVVMVVTVVYSVLGSFGFLYNCQPIAKFWDITITNGKCINITKILLTYASLNILTDIAMLLLPIALVRKLKLPMKQKLALAGLFMTGTLVCIISGIRMKVMVDLVRTTDLTWVSAEATVWSILELCVGVMCACLACLKPFFRRHFPRLLSSSNRSNVFNSRAANPTSNGPISGYVLESSKGWRKSGVAQKSKEQSSTINESQEDILRDGYLKDTARANEATISDARSSQKGSFLSDRENALPVS
ncbi:hypothetical protein BGZ60DRAFT_530816 [Tricladium varicosporioides]|nr:hypothetical protein BGZ60DRAFT_530816 [Hymenoscyphus varicosporioides]